MYSNVIAQLRANGWPLPLGSTLQNSQWLWRGRFPKASGLAVCVLWK